MQGLSRGCSLGESLGSLVAALLAQMGAVALPIQTAEKLYAGEVLSEEEALMTDGIPRFGVRLLARTSPTDGVVAILDACRRPAGRAGGEPRLPGADVLRIALDYEDLETSGLHRPRCAGGDARARQL